MLDLPLDLLALIVTKPQQARIHVDGLGGLQPEKLQQKLDPCGSWTHVVAFRPTGETNYPHREGGGRGGAFGFLWWGWILTRTPPYCCQSSDYALQRSLVAFQPPEQSPPPFPLRGTRSL